MRVHRLGWGLIELLTVVVIIGMYVVYSASAKEGIAASTKAGITHLPRSQSSSPIPVTRSGMGDIACSTRLNHNRQQMHMALDSTDRCR